VHSSSRGSTHKVAALAAARPVRWVGPLFTKDIDMTVAGTASVARVSSHARTSPAITVAQIDKTLPKLQNLLRQLSNGGRPFKISLKQFEAELTRQHPRERALFMAIARHNFPDTNLMGVDLQYGGGTDLRGAADASGKITEGAMLRQVKRNTDFGNDPAHPQQFAMARRNDAMRALFAYLSANRT
jgi:hypothetical protein